MFKLSLIFAAVLSLSACSKGISVGTDATTGADDSRKIDLGFSKSLSVGSSANITSTVPASQIISQGMRAVVEVSDMELGEHVRNIKYYYEPMDISDAVLDALGYGTNGTPAIIKERATIVRTSLFKFKDSSPAHVFAAENLLSCTDLALELKPEAKECYREFYTRASTAAAILAASWAQKVPGIDGGEFVYQTGKTRNFNQNNLTTWLFGSLGVAHLANEVQYHLAQNLEGNVLKNPDAASLAAVELLFDLPRAKLKPLLAAEYVKSFPDGLIYNVSPGEFDSPLEVSVDTINAVLTQNEKGLLLTKNGSPWFGDGHLNGFKTEIALARTTNTNMDRKQSVALDKAEKATQSNKAGVSLQ